jgi:hypothetical protein
MLQNSATSNRRLLICKAITSANLHSSELYILPTYTEEPKYITASSGLLPIEDCYFQGFLQSVYHFDISFFSSTGPIKHNVVMIL